MPSLSVAEIARICEGVPQGALDKVISFKADSVVLDAIEALPG